jgi:hypothetical protein
MERIKKTIATLRRPRMLFVLAALALPFAAVGLTITGNAQINASATVFGSLAKGGGSFVIDDPTDPSDKLLYHSFVESPSAQDLYNGTATVDKNGEIIIKLPDYFDALNENPQYQFFPIGEAMPNLYIKTPEKSDQFTIAGGVPGGQVSWQIIATRHDPYIEKYPPPVEVDKGPGQPVDKGTCLFAPLCQ